VDDDGRAMMKARLAPGTVYPPHERFATEECLVLAGDFWADNQKLVAGDFIAGRTGNEPLPLWSEGGCELLLKIPIPYQIMPKAPEKK
jgi:anti-sigma factor ChrR (cupin superfamily)